jgi:hypothetical protein
VIVPASNNNKSPIGKILRIFNLHFDLHYNTIQTTYKP